jgi:hypothetical protein
VVPADLCNSKQGGNRKKKGSNTNITRKGNIDERVRAKGPVEFEWTSLLTAGPESDLHEKSD